MVALVLDHDKLREDHSVLLWNFEQFRTHMTSIEEDLALQTPAEQQRFEEYQTRLEDLRSRSPELAKAYQQARGHMLAIEEHLLHEREDLADHAWCRYKHGDLADSKHVQRSITVASRDDLDFARELNDFRGDYRAMVDQHGLRPADVERVRREWDEVWGFDPDISVVNTRDLADVGHLQEALIYSGGLDPEFAKQVTEYRARYLELTENPSMSPTEVRAHRNRWRQLTHDPTLGEFNEKAAECKICSKDTHGIPEMKEQLDQVMEEQFGPAPAAPVPEPVEILEPIPEEPPVVSGGFKFPLPRLPPPPHVVFLQIRQKLIERISNNPTTPVTQSP